MTSKFEKWLDDMGIPSSNLTSPARRVNLSMKTRLSSGRISKRGNGAVRAMPSSALKVWVARMARRSTDKKARAA